MPKFLERVLCVALAVAFIGYFPAQAQEAGEHNNCIPAPLLIERALSMGFEVRPLAGWKAEKAVAYFNSWPDMPQIKWPAAILIYRTDKSGDLFVGSATQLCAALHLDPEVFKGALLAIDGGEG